jgi:hypothetical protein
VREWAVQWRTFRDGPYDRTMTAVNGQPFTRETAEEWVQGMAPGAAQVVYRNVDEWRPPRVKGPVHGTTGAYTNHGCRCDPCMQAWNRYQQRIRQRRKQVGLPADSTIHGTSNGYNNYGCRCEPCRAAHNASQRRSRYAKHSLRKERSAV